MVGINDFIPDRDIPSLNGKVILITGGTAGLGRASIVALAKHNPAHIYFTGRSQKAADTLIEEIRKTSSTTSLTFIELDLSDLSTIKSGLVRFTHDRLDVLMCNAGIMAKPPAVSVDGWEIHFATNHLGHAAIIQLLLPVLLKTAEEPESDVRVVCTTSLGWRGHPSGGISFDSLNTVQDKLFGRWLRYGQSKFANIVYAKELARRYPKIKFVSVHPGVINTGLVTDLPKLHRAFVEFTKVILQNGLTLDQGIRSQLWLVSVHKNEVENGALYLPVGEMSNHTLDKDAKNQDIADRLWNWTEKALQGHI